MFRNRNGVHDKIKRRAIDGYVLIQYEVLTSNLFCKSSFLYECETFSLALRDGRTRTLEAFKSNYLGKFMNVGSIK